MLRPNPTACLWNDPEVSRVVREAQLLAQSNGQSVSTKYLVEWLKSRGVCSCGPGLAIAEQLERYRAFGVNDEEELHRLGGALRNLLRKAGAVPCANGRILER